MHENSTADQPAHFQLRPCPTHAWCDGHELVDLEREPRLYHSADVGTVSDGASTIDIHFGVDDDAGDSSAAFTLDIGEWSIPSVDLADELDSLRRLLAAAEARIRAFEASRAVAAEAC